MRLFAAAVFAVASAGIVSCQSPGDTSFDRTAPLAVGDALADLKAIDALAPRAPAADAQEISAFFDAIGDLAAVDVGAVEDGVARNVVFRLPADERAGLRFEEVRLWGADPAARTVARLEAVNGEIFGLGAAMQETTNAYTKAIVDAVDSVVDDDEVVAVDMEAEFSEYTVSFDRLVAEGATFHALDAPVSSSASETSFATALALVGQSNRWLTADALILEGSTADMRYTQAGQETTIRAALPFAGYIGLDRGDLDFAAMEGFKMTMGVAAPWEEGGAPVNFSMGYDYDLIAVSGIEAASLFEYFSQGRLPPRDETDVVSLGQWRLEGERQRFGDKVFYAVDETDIDLSSFHWLVPTDVSARSLGGLIDLGAMAEWAVNMGRLSDDQSDDAAEDGLAQITAAIGVLEKHGLDQIRFDADSSLEWDPVAGLASARGATSLVDLFDVDFNVDGLVGAFDRFADVNGLGDSDSGAALMTVFMDAGLDRASFVIADRGGLDRVFAAAPDFAALAGEGDQSTAALAQMEPDDIRAMATGLMRVGAAGAAAQFPPAVGYINRIADYLDQGGTLSIQVEPAERLNAALFEAKGPAIAEDPAQLEALLGLSVEHTPPSP